MPNHKAGNGFFIPSNRDIDAQFSGFDVGGGNDSFDQGTNRFVAGNKFFNYQQFGALRDGGGVALFSSQYYGIIFATFGSSFIYAMLRYCLRPTLMNSLDLQRVESSAVTECLLSIPTTLSFFLGMLTDVAPICGYRRKSYMIVGLLLSFCMTMGLAVLAALSSPDDKTEEERANFIIYYMVLIMGATLGTMLLKVGTDSRVIELSQREPLTTRGELQINYLLVRTSFEACTTWLTALLVTFDEESSNYHLKVDAFWLYAILACASLLPIPFIISNCAERTVQQQHDADVTAFSHLPPGDQLPLKTTGVNDRLSVFFRMCQQRAVWQIVLFLSIVLATTRFYFGAANSAFKSLADLDANTTLITNAIKYFANIGALVWWKISWSNRSWRRCVFLGLFVTVFCETLRALLMLYVPATRDQAMYDTIGCIMGYTDGVITIFSYIPATEIAENGSEGATIGMLLSFRSTLAIAMRTLSEQWMRTAAPVSSTDGTGRLCLLLMITSVVHSLSFFSLWLLPRQKLDAQQLRVYGGYSKSAAYVLWLIFVVFFVYSMQQNISAMIDMANATDDS